MKGTRTASVALAVTLLLLSLSMLTGCSGKRAEVVLRVYNWEEYIDEGGEGAFLFDFMHEFDDNGEVVLGADGKHVHIRDGLVDEDYEEWYTSAMGVPLDEEGPSMIDDFERWYEKQYGVSVKVEYSTFGTNEDMYNEIVLGNEYDLLCPSDYMIMKLAAEGRLEKYDSTFFDESIEENYYIRNVSPYIREKFETNAGLETAEGAPRWSEYAAGYMWGTTGFVYNPAAVSREELDEKGWQVFIDPAYSNKITAKDNVRDTYFAALGVAFEDELLSLDRTDLGYNASLTRYFNATDEETISRVEPVLMRIKDNIYSFETDTGKADMVNGKIWLNYAWSGDAVYAMDLAESEDDTELAFYVPKAGSNLFFDGWVMPKGVTERKTKHAAQAFVNFLSMPQNAMRNSYYIGYTSVISGENDEMLDYADYFYGVDRDYEESVKYDLSYFFGDAAEIYTIPSQAMDRQLFAQFPPADVIERCAVMDYYGEEATVRINELWSRVKAETLDAWAIIVICVTVAAIVIGVVAAKFGGKIDFFRRKPKKGYSLVKQEQDRGD